MFGIKVRQRLIRGILGRVNFSQFRSDLPPFAFTDAVVNQAQGQFADSTFYLGNLITSIKYLLKLQSV